MKTDNELIAKFMGAEVEEATPGIFKRNQRHFNFSIIHGRCPAGLFVILPEELKYHESWDWLMPVVEKIHELDVNSVNTVIEFHRNVIFNLPLTCGIDNAYKAVVDFIKWYNEQKSLAS